MGEALNLTPFLSLHVAKHAKDRGIDFNEAGLLLLDRALHLGALSKAAGRKSPWIVASALLIFVENLSWPTGIGVTARDLFFAVHGGNWDCLSPHKQKEIVSLLIEETKATDSCWKLKCVSETGVSSTFFWE